VPDFKFGVDNKDAVFLSKFPLGKVPCCETPEGPLFESNAISYYVARSGVNAGLLGSGVYEEALIQQWISFAEGEISSHAATWLYPLLGYMTYNKLNLKKAQDDLKHVLHVLDEYLLTRTYLVGHSVTLADIHVAMALVGLYKMVFDAEYRSTIPNVTRYMLTLLWQPNFVAVMGEPSICEKAIVYEDQQKAKAVPKAAAEEVKAPKDTKPEQNAATATTDAKPAAKPAKKEADDDEEEDKSYEDAPKGTNVLDQLPPSTFGLDAWKRFFSNNSEADARKHFWENIDRAGYSVWQTSYMFNQDLQQVYKTCNLLTGFFQRAEQARKYAFGSFVVFGEDNANEIHGIWVFRGQDVIAEIKDVPDFESYTFRKCDLDNEGDKSLINAFLAWNEDEHAKFTVTSKKVNQGKSFK